MGKIMFYSKKQERVINPSPEDLVILNKLVEDYSNRMTFKKKLKSKLVNGYFFLNMAVVSLKRKCDPDGAFREAGQVAQLTANGYWDTKETKLRSIIASAQAGTLFDDLDLMADGDNDQVAHVLKMFGVPPKDIDKAFAHNSPKVIVTEDKTTQVEALAPVLA